MVYCGINCNKNKRNVIAYLKEVYFLEPREILNYYFHICNLIRPEK